MDGTCALRLTRSYAAPPDVVWAALTDPVSRTRWLGPISATLDACVRAAEPERLLELDWTPPGEPPSVVRFELRADGDGTALVVDHRRLDARLGMRALRLWEAHLSRLDTLLGAEEA